MNRVSSLKSKQSIPLQEPIFANDQQMHIRTFKIAKSTLQKIERLEKKIQSFHQEDQRLFQEWEQAHFHEKRLQFASLQSRCYVLTHFHNRMLATARLLKVSISRAYQILKDEEEAFETGSDETRAILKRAWAERDQFAQTELARAAEEALEDQKRKASSKGIKDKLRSFMQKSSSFQISPPGTVKPPWEGAREELKLTYRKLVRKLHPDYLPLNSRLSAQTDWMSQYWHQAQDAYKAKDQATLEKLSILTAIQLQDLSSMTFADVEASANWLQHELETLQAKANVFKRSRAWGFAKRKNHQSLIAAITKDFSRQMAPLHKQIQHLDFYHKMLDGGRKPLQALQKLADSQVRPRKRRQSVNANQTSFLEFLN